MGMLDSFETAVRERTDTELAVTSRVVEDPDELADELAAAAADAAVVGPRTPVTGDVLHAAGLDLVARAGVGLDNVDREAARETETTVTNAPDYCTEEVASHAVSLIVSAARRLSQYDHHVRDGGGDCTGVPAPRRLSESTLGCVGFGAIARRAVTAADALVGETLAYDPYVDEETAAEYGVETVGFEELTRNADLLAVFAPLTPETEGLVDDDALQRLPTDAVVINVGRGGVVDSDALARALEDGGVAAAGLDVLPTEPPQDSPLVGRDDVLVTPHSAWYSAEAQQDLLDTVAGAVAAVADGGRPEQRVTRTAGTPPAAQ